MDPNDVSVVKDAKNNNEEDCIWSPKIFNDVIESISLVREQMKTRFDVDQMTMAIGKDITFGITTPPMDMQYKFSRILQTEVNPPPVFYRASEMGHARRLLSLKNSNAINACKIRSAKMTKLCKGSDAKSSKLIADIRLALFAHHRKRIQSTIDIASSSHEAEMKIERLVDAFVDGIITSTNDIVVTDTSLAALDYSPVIRHVLHQDPLANPQHCSPSSQPSSSGQRMMQNIPTSSRQSTPNQNTLPLSSVHTPPQRPKASTSTNILTRIPTFDNDQQAQQPSPIPTDQNIITSPRIMSNFHLAENKENSRHLTNITVDELKWMLATEK